MNNIESLTDLFELVGCKASFYDIGRHVSKITPAQVIQFDKKQQPYPYAFKQQAWLAILLHPLKAEQNAEPVIWFIRLPIDEKGSLNLGTRDHLIKSIVDRILNKDGSTDISDALKDNPYAFQPDHERMASFHAALSVQFKKDASSFFNQLVTYLESDLNEEDTSWQALGLQGIADLAVRANQEKYLALIKKAIEFAPQPVAVALAKALEHERPEEDYLNFVEAIYPTRGNTEWRAALIRSVSKAAPSEKLLQSIKLSLVTGENQATDDELQLIVAIVAKCPSWFNTDPELLSLAMENLANRTDGYVAFSQIASELSHTPVVRGSLWSLFRGENRSPKLTQAIGSLFTKAPEQVQ
ncbi:MAG: DUF3549 family protein [Marinomonas sp.]|uniref:DUF3549 family protein n=1 Tax=unclassified Marinomonas TaxID=196814 RepID=UPI0005F9E41D|nr:MULTISPECIES: DUF3549 family protein [unclassified Marinomonas]KJZ14270.1 hypothetical protein TW85_10195 [Marinomonas sp. S3726]KZM44161.1 hypothetical protein OA92_05550 [Marinomonas sp. SBI22]KZM45320.1 hypothetical protein OA91_06695 [Marinomonas sp. SBI8L]